MNDTVTILSLLQKRRQFYEAILELALLEKSSLEQNRLDETHQYLTQKKILLNCIEEIEAKLSSYPNFLRAPLKRDFKKELTATKKILKELLRLDSHNQSVLHDNWSSQRTSPHKISG